MLFSIAARAWDIMQGIALANELILLLITMGMLVLVMKRMNLHWHHDTGKFVDSPIGV
jgi:hypothetical protein